MDAYDHKSDDDDADDDAVTMLVGAYERVRTLSSFASPAGTRPAIDQSHALMRIIQQSTRSY